MIEKYRTRGETELPPHVFVIADQAYRNVLEKEKNQSIIIRYGICDEEKFLALTYFYHSGESGAGKTEATKQCLQYLAESSGSDTNVEQRILLANPLLEAWGNAKTVRNNNSSRFGKYIEMFLDSSTRISGASNTNYLLEKSRVVSQSGPERNYVSPHLHFSTRIVRFTYRSSRCVAAHIFPALLWRQQRAASTLRFRTTTTIPFPQPN